MASKIEIKSLREAGIKLIDCVHKTPPASDSGFPYIGIPQMGGGRINPSAARLISESNFKKWTEKARPQENDIILSRRCNPGETAWVPPGVDWALGQNLVLLRATGENIYPPFLRWVLQCPQWWSEVKTFINVGAIFESLKCVEIPEFKVPLPGLEDQKAISGLLWDLDNKAENLRRQNQTLENIAQTLFKRWFIEFEFPDKEGKPYKSSGGKMVESELGEIPEGWKVGTVNDLCQKLASGGTPSTKNKEYYSGEINWFSTKELNDNYLFESEKKITEEGLSNSSAKFFPRGAVIMAIYAAPTVGRLGILARESTFNQAACGFIADENICCGEFIYLLLLYSRRTLNNLANGAAQQN